MPLPSGHRGRLKLFLGYAAGVGKTYRMLEEAHQLRAAGVDIVIGYVESHRRKDTIAMAAGLEAVARRALVYRGKLFTELDTAAVLLRQPAVCLVDELAHTNVPGSERGKRWEDVLILLEAGMDVHTTMNVQHLESLNDQIYTITGVRVQETVPDWVVKQADEVVMIDATPAALLNRLKRGAVYEPEQARRALEHFFKASTLTALRELALRQTAHEVDVRQEKQDREAENQDHFFAENGVSPAAKAGPVERILIHITEDPSTAMLIRRGRRVADFLRADCFALYVCPHSDLAGLPPHTRRAIEKYLNFARNLHIETRVVQGEDAAREIVAFSGRNQVSQIFLLREHPRTWGRLLHKSLVSRVVDLAKDIRITVVSARGRAGSPSAG